MTQKTWIGGTNGLFLAGTNWSPFGVPGVTDDVTIASAGADVSLSDGQTATIDSLAVVAGDTMAVSGGTLSLLGTGGSSSIAGLLQVSGYGADGVLVIAGSINDTGTIAVAQAASGQGGAQLLVTADTRLSGGGTIATTDNTTVSLGAGVTLTNVDDVFAGAGSITLASGSALINGGTIVAATTGESRRYLTAATGAALTNTGTILAMLGTLVLGGTVLDSGGTIAASGSAADLFLNGADIVGGTLATGGGGTIAGNGTLDNVLNSGTVIVGYGVELGLADAIVNRGTISVYQGDSNGGLSLASAVVTLSGGGTIAFAGGAISTVIAGATLDNVDNTIIGSGVFNGYSADALAVINGGTIDGAGQAMLEVTAPVINTGVIMAGAYGDFYINGRYATADGGGIITNSGGTIGAFGTDAVLLLTASIEIDGGVLTTGNGGIIEAQAGSFADPTDIVLDGSGTHPLTIAGGSTVMIDGDTLALSGAVTDLGVVIAGATLALGGTVQVGTGATLAADGTLTALLGGTGNGFVVLANNATLSTRAGVMPGATVRFTGVGDVLDIAEAQSFAGTLDGFGSTGTIDFTEQEVTGVTLAGSILNIYDDGEKLGTLALTGFAGSGTFDITPDGNQGYDVTAQPVANVKTWIGPAAGAFLTDANWSPTGVPGASDRVIIATPTTTVTVAQTLANGYPSNLTINSLGLVAGDTLVLDGPDFTILDGGTSTSNAGVILVQAGQDEDARLFVGGSVSNSGTIVLTGSLGSPAIYLPASTTLSGGGTIALGMFGTVQVGFGVTLDNVDNTIIGSGAIYDLETLVNAGAILSGGTYQGLAIRLPASDSAGVVVNTGVIAASGESGRLVLTGPDTNEDAIGTIVNVGGTLGAFGFDSELDFGGNVLVIGGTLATGGTGDVLSVISDTDVQNGNLTLDGLSLGSLALGTDANLSDRETLTLFGTIAIASGATLGAEGGLRGSGLVELADAAAFAAEPQLPGGLVVQFAGVGDTLVLGAVAGTVEGFNDSGTIHLLNVQATGATLTDGGVLSIYDDTILLGTLTMLDVGGGSFVTGSDGTNGTDITLGATGSTKTWVGPASDLFTNPADWSPAGVPGAGDDVIIATPTTQVTVPATVANGGASNITINSLTLAAGDTLVLAGQSFSILDDGASSSNAGVILVQVGTATDSRLFVDGSVLNSGTIALLASPGDGHPGISLTASTTLSGGGTIALGTGSTLQGGVGIMLDNVDNTIVGSGAIYGLASLVNGGKILTDGSYGGLYFQIPTSYQNGAVTNTGVIAAAGQDGLLELAGSEAEPDAVTTIVNAGGTLGAFGVGSELEFAGAIDVVGGTLASGGGGSVTVGTEAAPQNGNVTLDGFSLGSLALADDARVSDDETLTLLGTIAIGAGAALGAGGTLLGDGLVVLANTAEFAVGVLPEGMVVQFAGTGATLLLDAPGGTLDGFAGSDTIDLSDIIATGATLDGDILSIYDGSTLLGTLTMIDIAGGRFETGTDGADGTAITIGVSLTPSRLWIGPSGGSFLTAADWSPAGVPGPTDDVLIGAGVDVIAPGTSGALAINSLSLAAASTLSIQGATFGIADAVTDNDPAGTGSNAGLISVTSGTLALSGTLEQSGTIDAGIGGFVTLDGADIIGGILAATGGGQILESGSTLDGSAAPVTIADATVVAQNDAAGLSLRGTVDLLGTLAVNDFLPQFVASPTVTLTGGGIVALDAGGSVFLGGPGTTDVLVNAGDTFAGAGVIGFDFDDGSALGFINAAGGVLDGNVANALQLSTNGATTANAGLMEASNNGTLAIETATTLTQSGAGMLLANGGTILLQQDSVIAGGTLATAAGGQIFAQLATLDGRAAPVTIASGSSIAVPDFGGLVLLGTLVNRGTVLGDSTDPTEATDALVVQSPTVSLTGGGAVLLSDTAENRILNGSNGSLTLLNVDNTIAGAGQIGSDTLDHELGLINAAAGTIDASSVNALVIRPNLPSIVNAGLLEATGLGGLQIADGTTIMNAGGTLLAAQSTLALGAGGDVVGGTLVASGTGQFAITSATLDGRQGGVSVAGVLAVGAGSTLALLGSVGGVGSLALGGTLLVGAAGATLATAGMLVLAPGALVSGTGQGGVLENRDAIIGAGNLGAGGLGISNDAGGTIAAAGGMLVLDAGAGGTIRNAGLISSGPGAALSLGAGGLVNTGTIEAVNGALAVGAGAAQAGTLTGGTWLASGATLTLAGGPVTDDAAAIVLAGTASGFVSGPAMTALETSLLRINAGGTLALTGGRGFSAAATVGNAGTVLLGGGSFAAAGLVNTGLVAGTGTLATSTANSGTVAAVGGALSVGPVTGGTLAIGGGGSLVLDGGAAGGSVAFGGAGRLVVTTPGNFSDVIGGFGHGDLIELVGITGIGSLTFDPVADTLSLISVHSQATGGASTTTVAATLTLTGTHSASSFSFKADSNGQGTDVLPCFHAGTRIATPQGDVAVEALRVGDLVLTPSGPRAVRWIGDRRLTLDRHPRPDLVRPVCIAAGAFGLGQPLRDLLLSPDHAIACDGVLIPVRLLLNGASITQLRPAAAHYFHVELATHDLLLSEGLWTESYLDTGNRAQFSGGSLVSLHADFSPCLPLCLDGAAVTAARRRLLAALPASAASLLELCVEGRVIQPARQQGLRSWFVVPRSRNGVATLLSDIFVPAARDPESSDCRVLGVGIVGLVVNGRRVGLERFSRGDGYYPVERDGGTAFRWTDGAARIGIGQGSLEVRRKARSSPWTEGAASLDGRARRRGPE